MIPFASTTSSQIRFLLQSLNDSNSDSVFQELCQFATYGIEGRILLLGTIFDYLSIYGKDLKNIQFDAVYSSIFKYILDKPNFSTVFCVSIRGVTINEEFLENLCNALRLSVSEKIEVGLALSDSENADVKMCGKSYCMGQIVELCSNQMSFDSVEHIQSILLLINQSEGLSKHVDLFMHMLSLVQSKGGSQFILSPLLSDELREVNFWRNFDDFNEDSEDDFDALLMEMEKEMSMADTMKELGYGCTANALQCKEILSLFLPLTEITVARILGMIVRTYSGLEDNQNIFSTFRAALGSTTVYDLPSPSSWNGDVLIDAIKELAPGLNWGTVMKNLDHEGFYVLNEAAFAFLMSMYKCACQDPFPLQAVCGSIWKNSEGQLSFLSHAVVAPPEVFTFAHSGRQMAYVDAVNDHKFQHGHSNHAWLCLDLLEVLCQLAERGHANSVRSILEHPLKHCPELLLLGLSHINTVYNLLQHEISSTVFPMILKNAPGMGMIHYLWHVNPSILVRGFVDAITIDTDNISRVLEACQELKILSPVLDMLPSNLSIRLAAVASMKGLIDLEKWLNTNLSTYKDKFYEECLKFLKEVQFGAQDVSTNCFHPPNTLLNIYLEASSMFIKLLQSHTGLISSHYLSEELEKLNMTYMNSNSRLKTVGASNSSTSDAHADDIEAEVNSYFQQMFHEERSVETIIQMLTRFKESSDKREQAVFEFMIANLFEEYKFFSKYPDKQLTIAAVLFGSLIKCQLVTHLTLGIALRAVLDALRKPADSKMFSFGTKALDQFRERLIEWPQYCNHILQISHLRVNHLDIVLYIERALARISSAHSESDIGNNAVADPFPGIIQSSTSNVENSPFTLGGPMSSQSSGMQLTPPVQLPPRQQSTLDERKISTIPSHMKTLSSTSQTVGVPSSDASNIPKSQSALNSAAAHTSSPGFTRPNRTNSTRFGSALNIETLVAAAERRETPIEAPASEVQDKVSFIINNLAIQNVDTKAKEFAEILKEQYYPWFAQYMVMKRASIEQNFHDLYLKFLDKVNSKALYKEVVQATYENCKVLLGSELIKSSSEERSLLKNLGSWLGKITIGRNQVLRAREIDPKSLIIEAYEKGLMIAVIPFTSKILEPCQSSLAYQPPNPWTMGILGLLAEIYAMPNLKMNLKFDIEVLFKNLGVDLKDVAPTSLLKDRVREVEGNPDFSNKDAGSSQSQIVTDVKSGLVSTLNQVELPLEAATSSHPGSHSRILSQYASPLHLPSATLMEEEKLVALVDQHQIPSGQGIIPGQTPFSVSQLPTPTSNIEQQVIINPRLRALGMHVHFQSVLPIAMDRAIKEIVTSIVHRSVSIATQTTKELVLKDYAMESDETRIRNAAHLMVASLAGSLAHVTCKEPLRGSISSQLRSTLQGLSISSELLEQAVQLVTNDNLDLGCALIEQAATEKAIQTIDETIAQQLAIRKHREGPTFFDSGVYTPGHMGVLPEALRPKPGRLSHSQQRVYEDFVRLPLQNQSGQSSNTLPVGPSPSPSSSGLSRAYVAGSGQMNPAIYSAGLVNAGISSVPQPLDIVSEEIDASSSQLHSASSPNNGMGDGGFENDTIAQLSSASTAELQPVEQSNVVKEPGLSVQPPNSTPTSERHGNSISEPLLTTGDALDKYQIISEKLENLVSTDAKEAEIQGIIAEVPAIILRCISRDEAALAVAQKVFKGLYENASNTVRVNAHLAILAAIRDVSKLVVKELTSWVTYSDEERKFNKDITVGLIRSELLNLAEYNVHMAKLIDAGRNKPATEFAISLIQTLVMSDSRVISATAPLSPSFFFFFFFFFFFSHAMAYTSSIIGVSSIFQANPSLEHSKRPTSTPPLSFPQSFEKLHFNPLKAFSSSSLVRSKQCSSSSSSPFVASAVVTPNSSLLSEEAFKGLGGFAKDSLSVSDAEYDSELDEDESELGAADSDDELAISKLGLPRQLVETLEKRGITNLFPIQRAVLIPALEGRDIIARAKTGTGKTLAFGIPIIKRITEDEESKFSQRRGRLPRVLVLAPTRELAKQVEKEIKESAPHLNTACIYGGVSYVTQESALSRGVDVVVGTPGRLIDLINNNSLKLGEVQYLVLDEADQMLAVGFEEDVEVILEKLPSQRQSMLFSATMPGWVKKLARKYLNNPLTIDLVGDEEEKLAEGIKLYAISTTATSKRTILSDLITVYAKGGKTIVFTQTKKDADEVSMALTNIIPSEALHGDISQHQRERTLNGFRQGKFTVLVATDVASRGLDIPNVDLVIHYELPNDPETFVHRSGRTGRAGKEGNAILMFTSSQRRTVRSLERDVGCRFDFVSPPSVNEVLGSSAEQVVVSLGGVHSESIEYFMPTANKLMEEQGVNALAAALALLGGFAKPPSSRSLITHEQGWVTLQLTRDTGFSRGFMSARSVTGFLSDVYSAAADEVGKIQIIADERVNGAVFDLPEEVATELLNQPLPPGNTITKITKLPALQDDGPPSDFYGRFSNRDRGSRGGGFRDRRGGRGASRSWSSGRFSDNDSDDLDDGFRRGGRSRRGGSDLDGLDDGFRRGGRSRRGGSDWLIGDMRSNRSSSAGGNRDRNFSGACFNCGRTGHRASECPSKRGGY